MSFAQTLPHAKYFIGLSETIYYEPLPNAVITSGMLESDFAEQTGTETGSAPTSEIYFDLGKTITTVDANGKRVSVYRLARYVNGIAYEGYFPDHPPFYIRTWGADASYPVTVARVA